MTKIIDAFGTRQNIGAGPYIEGLPEISYSLAGDYILLHDASGQTLGRLDIAKVDTPILVQNTSGVTVGVGDVGYINDAGEYKETTTAYASVSWCVVLVGGANNADIYVARRGRVTVVLNDSCSVGDYLYTSTTAGRAQPSSTVRSELFAVALTANTNGAGGTCEALLYCNTIFLPLASATYVWHNNAGHSGTKFVAAIDDNAGAHGGQGLDATHVPYDSITAGDDAILDPDATGTLADLRLWNTVDNSYRLIVDVDKANDVITTQNSVDAWADNDAITIESQTVVIGAPTDKFVELDLSGDTTIPALARTVAVRADKYDTGGAAFGGVHPFEAYGAAKAGFTYSPGAALPNSSLHFVKLNQRVFCWRGNSSGSTTAQDWIILSGAEVAVP